MSMDVGCGNVNSIKYILSEGSEVVVFDVDFGHPFVHAF